MLSMTLHETYNVGVRDLHDRLSEHLGRVEHGAEARISAVDAQEPLEALVRRGLVTAPARGRRARRPTVRASASVSDLVADERR